MKKLKVKKGSTCMACLACVRACSESFYKEFDPDKSCIQIVEKKSVRPMALPTVRQMCGSLSGRCNHPESKGCLYDQQEKMYRLWQMCRSLSIWSDRKNRGQPGIQMYCLRHLCKSMSDGCTGSC